MIKTRRSFLLLLIALMLCIPMVGILLTVHSTMAQNSTIEITKVARVDGNFLEVDVVNHGNSDVSVSVGGFSYSNAPRPPYESPYAFNYGSPLSPYFINDAYHYTVSYANVSIDPWCQDWASVPAGQMVRLFTQGRLQNIDNWIAYRALVCENWQFRQLYPDTKVAYIGTIYHDARVPTVLYGGQSRSYHFCFDDPRNCGLTRGEGGRLVFGLYKFSGGTPQLSDLLCDRQITFYIDNEPVSGKSWYNVPAVAITNGISTGLDFSPQDTMTLSPGMHMFTAGFLGDSTYGPSSLKLIFRVA